MSEIYQFLTESWQQKLSTELTSPDIKKLFSFVEQEFQTNKIYPKKENIFTAFNRTPFEKIKVVILGQDPYHGKNQANGLSFSVRTGTTIPPSLKNIFKELNNDLSLPLPYSGDLSNWADQGVLLLNSILTVKESNAGSHKNQGWEKFTDSIIRKISSEKQNIVFILWGAYAKEKSIYIDHQKHLILTASHPSFYSANKGFFGSKPFSKTNHFLKSKNITEIEWALPSTNPKSPTLF